MAFRAAFVPSFALSVCLSISAAAEQPVPLHPSTGQGGRAGAATVQDPPAPPGSGPGGAEQAPNPPAQDPSRPSKEAQEQETREIEELKRRIDVLAAELERLRSGEQPEEPPLDEARRRALGLAPSAATAYGRRQGVSFAGYGEMLYEDFAATDQEGRDTTRGAQIDFLRLIVYSGYRFDERFVFNSEIEFEHTSEVSVEFAYLDFSASDALTIRGGLLLLPMGLINEFHEPTVFLGARRPETERRILPTTWRENGVGLLGSQGPVSYRVYLVNGLDAAGFSAAGLRAGRQNGGQAKATDLAFVGRVDFAPAPGVLVGGSLYAGGSDQGALAADAQPLAVGTTIGEVHAQAQIRGWDLRALYARAALGNVGALNEALELHGAASIGERQAGGYVQAGYNLLSQLSRALAITPYYRFERVNTQARVPAGFARNPALDTTLHTFGVEMKPIPAVVIKADYQRVVTKARTGVDQFNLGLGYAF